MKIRAGRLEGWAYVHNCKQRVADGTIGVVLGSGGKADGINKA